MNIYFVTVSLLHENMRHAAGLHSDTNIVIAESEDEALSIMRNLFRPYILNDDSVFISNDLKLDNAVQRGNGSSSVEYLNFPCNVSYDTLKDYLELLKDHYNLYEYAIYDKSGEVKILNNYLRDLKAASTEPASPVLPYDAEDSSTIPESYVKMIREQHDAVMTLLKKIDTNTDEVESNQVIINNNIDEESTKTQKTITDEFDTTRKHITTENNSIKNKISSEASSTRSTISYEESLTRDSIESMKSSINDKLDNVNNSVNDKGNIIDASINQLRSSVESGDTQIIEAIELESTNIQNKLDIENEELKSSINAVKTSVDSVDAKVSAENDILSNIEINTDNSAQKLSSLETDVQNVQSSVNNISDAIESSKSAVISEVQTQSNSINSSVKAVKDVVDDIKTSIDSQTP